MRVYIPALVSELEDCVSGTWAPTKGYAVTPMMRDVSSSDDDEVLEEQARDAAGTDSVLELGSTVRAVVVADYARADVAADPGGHPAAVTMTGRLMPDAIACIFADERESAPDAAAAANGDAEALGRLDERTMLWFDISEATAVAQG